MKPLNLVVFSGAGMSAESGIQTFRNSDGLWEQHRIEDVATPQAWNNNPDLVTQFYNERRKTVLESLPNKAHYLISTLEDLINVTVITQNIDDLHERAGSSKVLHLHGNIRFSKSSGPNQELHFFPIEGWELTQKDLCPEGYRLRPHVVWFGEEVPAYEDAAAILAQADIVIVIGTSLQVYPAAGLIHYANNASHKYLIDPNADKLSIPNDYTRINGGASEGMVQIIDELKKIL